MNRSQLSLLTSILMSVSFSASAATGTVSSVSSLDGVYLAVSNYGSSALSICNLSATDGSVGSCVTKNPSVNGAALLKNPAGSVFNPATNTLYVTNQGNNAITTCTYSATTQVSVCSNYSDNTFAAPSAAALSSDGSFLYITNGWPANNEIVSVCSIDQETGQITNDAASNPCQTIYTGTEYLSGIALFGASSLYVSGSYGGGPVNQCQLTSAASAEACALTAATAINEPSSLAFSADNSALYIGNSGASAVTACSVSSSGVLSNCSAFSDPSFNVPAYIALDYFAATGSSSPTAGYLYAANFHGNTISTCPVTGNALSGSCVAATGFTQPNGLAVLTPASGS